MNDRLQKQARGLLEEIEVGDWVVPRDQDHEDIIPHRVLRLENGRSDKWFQASMDDSGFPHMVGFCDLARLATPQELLDHGIIDEIPNPEYPNDPHEPMRFMGHLTNPHPLPQGDWTLATLVRQGFIYTVHSQNTDEGPMVHYRLTDEGREVVEMEGSDAH